MIWILLIVYQIKHLLADYFLQGRFMLGKFKPYPDFVMPLFCHALVHGIFTFFIACFIDPDHATWYALLDGGLHFVIDRVKASPKMLGRFAALSKSEMMQIITNQDYVAKFPGTQTALQIKATDGAKLKSNTYFWWSLGADQLAHHLTHYLIIFLMLR